MEAYPAVRPHLYPGGSRALLAICSDLDETLDISVYTETARFLNTVQDTVYGRGVGLEVGNTIYFDMPEGHLSYWNTDDRGREMFRALMQSGHIDCFHSYGDMADRAGAERALEELVRHDCTLDVWIDHARAPTNFGSDIMRGEGDVPGSPAYHADLTLAHGVRFVWTGRVTSVISQDVPLRFGGIWCTSNPGHSARTVLQQAAKQVLARLGGEKYSMHAGNRLLRPVRLRDGQRTIEFIRCNPHWGGVSAGETGEGLGDVLRRKVLDVLSERGGTTILYTHLGKGNDRARPLGQHTVEALRRLARYHDEGRIFVTTTARLLRYCAARRELEWSSTHSGGRIEIDVRTTHDQQDLQGISFRVPDPATTRLLVNGREVVNAERRCAGVGSPTIAIPWERLSFPLESRVC